MKRIKHLLVVAALVATTLFITPTSTYANMGVCTPGNFKSYMTMGALWSGSAQYQYLANNTYDRGDGLLVTNDGFIAVAMGPYYGSLGDKFYVTFSNGQVTPVVKVDEKAHFMAGCHGMSSQDGSVLEGILSGNPSAAFDAARYHGNIGMAYAEFAGNSNITSIVRVDGYVPPAPAPQPAPQPEPQPEPQVAPPQPIVEETVVYVEPVQEVIEAAPPVIEEPVEEKDRLMIIYIPEEEHENLLFVDTEFSGSERELIQVAMINFKKLNDAENLYFFSNSLNIYKDTKVTVGFENYTNIKQGFLGNYGLKPEEFIKKLHMFVDTNNLNNCNTLLIGHGLRQDHELLLKEGCNLMFVDKYDTFESAKAILEINTGLSLDALAASAGYFTASQHDAYQDAFALIPIFSQLKITEHLQ